ncbi:MAG TPA: M3 family oligoendopeptidase [Gemmataceae bacterium]|nr:M3 family oligoendopeptidase [Gemmataceae bacterium]
MQAVKPSSSADGVRWDLRDFYQSVDDPRINSDLEQALTRAQAFEARFRGQIAREGGPTAEDLLAAMQQLESISEQMDRPLCYAMLVHAAKTDEPKHGALLSKAREQQTIINKHLIFFDLEWVKVSDEAAAKILTRPELARYRHYLEQKRVWKPHYLSEPEEKILDEKSMTGKAAFVRLFDETISSLRFPFEYAGKTEMMSLQQINAKLFDPDRSIRKAAAEGWTRGLQENARLLNYIFNTLVLDHKSDCELRHFPHPMAQRHLANEISDEVVDALMTAVERNYTLVQRYYRLKARLLKLEPLYDYDRYAPLFTEHSTCPWPEARQIVQESYAAFSPKAGAIIREFFDKNWIDAELRPAKRSGAFSHGCMPSVHPYILMNYTDKPRDVMTLAHELGHGLHQYLSRPVGYLEFHTPLTTAETASVFGEMLTFQRLLQRDADPKVRLALLCGKIEDSFATVFRQVVLTRFEQSLHKARRERGELAPEQVNELWLAANKAMFADSLQLSEGYACWWMYIGHFIHSPFYCYAYSFGELLVLALVKKYQETGPDFVPKYLEMLAAGGSESPPKLVAKLGLDIRDPQFWELGLRLLGDMVSEAEQLVRAIGL